MAATGEQNHLTTEIINRGIQPSGPDAGSITFSVRVRRRLPDFLQSVKLKYVKLGYHYLINHGIYLATVPLLLLVFGAEIGRLGREELWRKLSENTAGYDLATLLALFALFIFTLTVYFFSRPPSIYLIDFACFKPPQDLKVTKEQFIELARKSRKFDEVSLDFQKKILESSGIGDETYVPKAIMSPEKIATMKEGRAEASMVIFGALDELFQKTGIRPKDIGILVVNCSIFNPTPSLSAMVVNHYKMRGNILSFNLGGMGCSAGIIAVDLARDMLQSNPNNVAVVVSTEMVGFNWYTGRDRSMLLPNCFFRMGCSAIMLSNRRRDHRRAKYNLEHIIRTHKGGDDASFRSIYQEEDEQRFRGLRISKDVVEIAGDAIKTNVTTLGPLVLPFSEQLFFFSTLVKRYFFGATKGESGDATKPYIPDFKLAFEHFCVHAASKTAVKEVQRNLGLSDANMEASWATLQRFGNTSSSSIWYELAYLEAKGRELWRKLSENTVGYDLATLLALFDLFILNLTIYFFSRPPSTYLIDFACFKPPQDLKYEQETSSWKSLHAAHIISRRINFLNNDFSAKNQGEQYQTSLLLWLLRWHRDVVTRQPSHPPFLKTRYENSIETMYGSFISLTPSKQSTILESPSSSKPSNETPDLPILKEQFIELARKSRKFDEASLDFQKKILESSGIGDETYVPKAIMPPENIATMKEGRSEASMVIFGALDELFQKNRHPSKRHRNPSRKLQHLQPDAIALCHGSQPLQNERKHLEF
ncbi:hypothetical protein L6452_03384 [Arctium lappa]|uniref:Uncharacterized protein n=1 Tax=Arctium lappa TaxID=4217 RepID=A0ACB9FN26_ARCLA|nr:hypothetical protein L6452_03384 [Arctium lappa]